MAVLSFPDPTLEQTYYVNGINYTWDGQKWTASSDSDQYVSITGDTMTGSVNVPERTLTAGSFDLSEGPYWTCGAIDVPNATNCVAGMTGTIRFTDVPTSFASYYTLATNFAVVGPCVVPFYVKAADDIYLGMPVEVG